MKLVLKMDGCSYLIVFIPNRKYAPRCSVCGEPIMPEKGQEETVRIVALDRSFHVGCYVCEVSQKQEILLVTCC